MLERYIYPWYSKDKPEKDPHKYEQLIFFNGAKQFNGERRVLTINDTGGNWIFTSPNKQTHTSKPHTLYKFNTMGIISLNLERNKTPQFPQKIFGIENEAECIGLRSKHNS